MSLTIIRKEDGQSLQFDASQNEDWSQSAIVSAHPNESGATFVDHVQRAPLTVRVRGIVTATPGANRGKQGWTRVEDAKAFLDACYGKLLTVGFARGVYRANMLLESHPHVINGSQSTTFDLSFVEALIANATTVQVPIRAVTRQVTEKVETGVQPATDATEAQTESASTILYAIGAFGGAV